MKYELKKTRDGSFTLYSKEYDECYHSVRDGALEEALKKHVEPAFGLVRKPHLKILDICFGLGINTLATIHHFSNQRSVEKITIYTPELDEELLGMLPGFHYPKELEPYKDILFRLIEERNFRSEKIDIELFVGDAREYVKGLGQVDIVYQDAFSPKKNPLLWTVEYFGDLYKILSDDGVLTTYSIAAPVRLGLWEAGFKVYEMQPEGLKKMTVASKKALPLQRIDMEKKMARSSSRPLRDGDFEKV